MINKLEAFGTITDEFGKDIPVRVIKNFKSEDGKRDFMIYTDIEEVENEDDRNYYVVEVVTEKDGTTHLDEVKDEDMDYCYEILEDALDELEDDEEFEEDED